MKLLRQGLIAICFLPVLALCGFIGNVVDQANEKPRYLVLSAPHGGPEIFEVVNSLSWSISGIFQWVADTLVLNYAKSSESFAELRSVLEQTVATSREVILDLEERVSHQQGSKFNSTALNERFAETVNKAQEKFEEIFRSFGEDEPEDREEADRRRREAVARALDCVENVFVDTVCELWAVSEDEPKERFRRIRVQVEHVIDVVMKMVDEHPYLFAAVLLVIPVLVPTQFIILRLILRLVGFGPGGVAKGSMASMCQRFFWGGAIAKKSWFSLLQHIAMRK